MSSPFDEAAGEDESATPRRRKLPPWWRWNVVTLSVSLFALMWAREISRLEFSTTIAAVLSIFGVWSVAPLVVLRDGHLPLSVGQQPVTRGHLKRRDRTERLLRFAFAARIMGVALALAGVANCTFTTRYFLSQWGYMGNYVMPYFVSTVLWPSLASIAGAVGLWTIGEIAITVAERRDD